MRKKVFALLLLCYFFSSIKLSYDDSEIAYSSNNKYEINLLEDSLPDTYAY